MAKSKGDDGKQHFDLWKTLGEAPSWWLHGGQMSKKSAPAATPTRTITTGGGPLGLKASVVQDKPAPAPTGGKADPWASKPAPTSIAAHPTSEADTKTIQQVLRNHGYSLKVDGVMGPLTTSALNDFHSSGGNAKKWNTANVPTSGASSGTSTGSSNTDAKGRTAGTNTGSGAGGTSGVVKTIEDALSSAKTIDPSQYTVNPKQYATAAANELYNPQVSAAQRTINNAGVQAKTNQADLTKWFGDAASITSAGADQVHTMEQQDQTNQAKAAASILAAFGGDAGGAGASLANTAQNGANALASSASSTDEFNKMLTGLVTNQGATAKTQQQNMDQRNIADMKGALTSLIAAKAAALTKGTADARNQNLANLLGITHTNNETQANTLNRAITEAELPYTLRGAQLANGYKAASINRDNAMYQYTLQKMVNAGVLDQANYNHIVAETNRLNRPKSGTDKSALTSTTAIQLSSINNALAGALVSKGYKNATPGKGALNAAKYLTSLVPWATSTPGLFTKVIMPSLSQAGITGVNAPMLGMSS